MRKRLILLFLLVAFQSCAQKKEEEVSRLAAEQVVNKYLAVQVKDKNYAVFSSGDVQFVVLIENADSFQEYFIDITAKSGEVYLRDTLFQSGDNLYKKMFNASSYRNGYVSFESDFYKDGYEIASGNVAYFVMITSNGLRHGESRLSFFVKPNPIAPEIYAHFTEHLLMYARDMNK
ncbi:hypothetical protein [Chryseolinea lacunae]|uniref:Lipoprotein n=1 Tax=Chryseolinea lacunae TaxID=2801331 RepID=A0ABS1KZS9_9BACT|nr:hypothetical protein [Chryseolinea lacunae]MBL0744970.1 hypothetical protein [Chryseolinea lacunae]